MQTKVEVTIEIDVAALRRYSNSQLAALWHVAQANPADGFEDETPGKLAATIGWEIIRRWLTSTEPEMYRHQARHYYWKQLTKLGSWNNDGSFVPHNATTVNDESEMDPS